MYIMDKLYKIANGRPLIHSAWCQSCYSANDFYLSIEGEYECNRCDTVQEKESPKGF